MKKGKRKTFRNKKNIAILIAVLAAFLVTPQVVYALYASQMYHKEVLVAGTQRARFSADYLQENAPANISPVLVKSVGDNPISLMVYNYPYGIAEEYSNQDIEYNITFRLEVPTVMEPGVEYKVNNTPFPEDTRTIMITGEKLPKGSEQKKNYYIVIPNDAVVSVTAVPTVDGLPTLSGKIRKVEVAEGGGQVNITWSGAFEHGEGSGPQDYAAFVYKISGSGKGNYTLKWDASKITLDHYFLEEIGQTVRDADGTWKYITFPVDSGEREIYDVRFYRSGVPDSISSWESIEAYIDRSNCYVEDATVTTP